MVVVAGAKPNPTCILFKFFPVGTVFVAAVSAINSLDGFAEGKAMFIGLVVVEVSAAECSFVEVVG